MAMNMASSSGGGGRRGRRNAVMAEINVTPMVDVMLVLLIIFMVAAPLMTSNIDIDLPIASGGKSIASNTLPLTLSVKRTNGSCNSNVELPVDRRFEEHFAGRGCAWHRGSAFCHSHRPYRRHPGDHFLQ